VTHSLLSLTLVKFQNCNNTVSYKLLLFFQDIMNYQVSPRMPAHAARASALTNNDCSCLTEIKDIRVRNNLLEEIFNVEDSIELDYFELERQAANFDSCLSGYKSPSQRRLSLETKQDEICSGFGVDSNGYQLHELQNRRFETIDSLANVNQTKRIGVCVTRPNTGQEFVAVASPTISSTCEGVLSGPAAAGVGSVPSESPSVNDSMSVHSTTNASRTDSITSTDEKTVVDKTQLASMGTKLSTLTDSESVQGYGARANVRPRPESRSRNTSLPIAGDNLLPATDISGDAFVPVSSSGVQPSSRGGSTTASSSSTSPSQLHVTKRQRVIDCGSDLLAEVREAYEYVQGADLYAPSAHPTFTDLNVPSGTFQPNTDHRGQPPMNFNFAGQAGSAPVAFVGNSRIGDWCTGSFTLQTGVPHAGSRSTASPSVMYQSCPDVASPGYPQVPELVTYARFPPQRPAADEFVTASLSAPTTPSKRVGPWSANVRNVVSPMSPSLQTSWQTEGSLLREHSMPVQLSRQNVAMNNQPNTSAHIPGYKNEPYVQQFGAVSRPHSPLSTQGYQRTVIHNAHQSRGHYTQPVMNTYSGNTHHMSTTTSRYGATEVGMGEGTPLSQNAFLRSVVDDESLVFHSHPLFPLLRDIIIADMNFHTPSFPFQLIANLPTDFGRLVQNYMQRNPRLASVTVSDPHTESVVVDALAYAHAALIGKITSLIIFFKYCNERVSLYLCLYVSVCELYENMTDV